VADRPRFSDRLVLEVRDLIPANQAHRWDVTPWPWDRRHADAPPAHRWQDRDTRDIRPAFTALRDGRLQSALECGVLADPGVSRLLAGEPTRICRAELTDKWVASLYAGLGDVAPAGSPPPTLRGGKARTRSGCAQPTR
jgi:hypothetical protein